MAKKKILLVDDEPNIVKLTKSRLEANGYEVNTACSGGEALEKLKGYKPDLILLDIVMPVMDGYEVCKKIKESEELKSIPIIIFSASQAMELEQKCREAGADEFIQKPFESEELLKLIKETLGG